MEAAAVARASFKIERATVVGSTRRQEHQAKREAASARRTSLFEAVRNARESRQSLRETRLAELAKLEQHASSLREKKLASTVSKSSAAVKHALEVVASLKLKESDEVAAKAARLAERLDAARLLCFTHFSPFPSPHLIILLILTCFSFSHYLLTTYLLAYLLCLGN
jgi:hypothetical protein